jgi:Tol biopolymer transport system component
MSVVSRRIVFHYNIPLHIFRKVWPGSTDFLGEGFSRMPKGKQPLRTILIPAFLLLAIAGCNPIVDPSNAGETGSKTPPAQTALAPTATPTIPPSATPTPTLRPDHTVLDGKSLTITIDSYKGLFLFDVDSRKGSQIVTRSNSRYPLNWEWSLDGSLLLFQTEHPEDGAARYGLNLLNPATGEQREISRSGFLYFHWHPNGRAVLIGNTFIDPSDGSVLAEFSSGDFDASQWMRAAISPDGGMFIMADAHGNGLHAAYIQFDSSGQVSGVSPFWNFGKLPSANMAGDIKWSPIGHTFAVETIDYDNKRGDVLLLDRLDGHTIRLTDFVATMPGHSMIPSPIAWSPDGERIAMTFYEQGERDSFIHPRVVVLNVASLGYVEITGGEFPYGRDAFWAPDGQGLVFIASPQNQLVACRPDGNDKRILAEDIPLYFADFRP